MGNSNISPHSATMWDSQIGNNICNAGHLKFVRGKQLKGREGALEVWLAKPGAYTWTDCVVEDDGKHRAWERSSYSENNSVAALGAA